MYIHNKELLNNKKTVFERVMIFSLLNLKVKLQTLFTSNNNFA